jgi:D-3-phosphoglycerate dehydrogenase / 2-oxoglutarate reductase
MIQNIIFDFDSTIINAEGIELLVERALLRINEKERLRQLKKLKEITNIVTDGKMTFSEAVRQRFLLANVTLKDVEVVAEKIMETINPQVRETIHALQERDKNVYVFSISFEALAKRVTRELGVPDENVFANAIDVDHKNNVVGVDPKQPLFLNTGKVYLAESLRNDKRLEGETAIVGDGYSDLLVRKNDIAKVFVYFAGTHVRPLIQNEADFTVDRFDQLLPLFCSTDELPDTTTNLLSKENEQTQPSVLLLENIHQNAVQCFLDNNFDIRKTLKKALNEKELCDLQTPANLIGIRSKTHLPAQALNSMKDLWAIGAFCIGTNQIDLDAASIAGIPVFNAPYSNTRSVAELVVGEAIVLMRKIPEKSDAAHNGAWLKGATGCSEIRGKTVGIIGYGHIGSQVSILLESLGMSIIFYDIVDKLPLGNAQKATSLTALLNKADIVTLHVPDTDITKNLIDKNRLAMMKPGSILINSSRGSVIDLDALHHALKSNFLSGAALDVFPDEPASVGDHFLSPLQKLPNVILTPHIGGSTEEAQINIANYVSVKLVQYVNTGSTTGAVNFPQIDMPRIKGTHRILHVHKNVPGVLAKINGVFARRNINIEGQILQTKDNIGYLVVDVNSQISAQVFVIMGHLPETIKVRRIT